MNKVYDFLKSISDSAKERLASSFAWSFVAANLYYHWKVVVILFFENNEDVLKTTGGKVEMISTYASNVEKLWICDVLCLSLKIFLLFIWGNICFNFMENFFRIINGKFQSILNKRGYEKASNFVKLRAESEELNLANKNLKDQKTDAERRAILLEMKLHNAMKVGKSVEDNDLLKLFAFSNWELKNNSGSSIGKIEFTNSSELYFKTTKCSIIGLVMNMGKLDIFIKEPKENLYNLLAIEISDIEKIGGKDSYGGYIWGVGRHDGPITLVKAE